MKQETLLVMLKANLEIITDYMDAEAQAAKDAELMVYITSAEAYIQREGINLGIDDEGGISEVSDALLVLMYAGWLYDKRKDPTAQMPVMLRWNMNNRLFAQKAQETT